MMTSELKQAPSLAGWAIGAAAGLVGAAVSVVVMGFSLSQAGFVGVILLLVVGVILGLPRGERPGPVAVQGTDPAPARMMPHASYAPPSAAPAMTDRAGAPVTPPASLMSAAPSATAEAAPAPSWTAAPPIAAAPAMTAAPDMAAVAEMPLSDAGLQRPAGLAAPRGGQADALQVIEGIGPKLEELCHRLGFYHFDQIANWTSAETGWVDSNLPGFRGRVIRDKWVAQAKLILSVGMDEFQRRARTNDY